MILIILLITSGVFLGFNYKDYIANNSTQNDYKQNIHDKEKQNNNLETELNSLKEKYEELTEEKTKEIEDYNEWKTENEEIVSYLA